MKNSFANVESDDGSGVRYSTDVKSSRFRSQIKASRVSSQTEEFNEAVCG